ncbi:071R [Cherax quadricarinatus iridovirus]|uniref:Uncharacterized protein n=1 Tax=Shrimp hemocyte iridescent virus TaxID=2039780 RepID=A0A291B0T0_9VIRU|nr:071R [Cherax quadricarinatus iridovirus]YP_010084833.1 hypothetical protein KM509_gp081 [Shrimp hemocyte iridescent virus]UPA43387.1 hypothetical protein 4TH000113 [Iridovirus CN01]ASZ85051.1 071R [Cherax quadricarinatus iridovirus]ATE87090.1 hypothetical protein [Shrimp hemocyte iridescent virus]UPA43463.1 hypothetical protein 3TG000030 [Iridovirus CN01]UPA43657.1 hypothetical protein 1DG000065 [Iridovirus CN01]
MDYLHQHVLFREYRNKIFDIINIPDFDILDKSNEEYLKKVNRMYMIDCNIRNGKIDAYMYEYYLKQRKDLEKYITEFESKFVNIDVKMLHFWFEKFVITKNALSENIKQKYKTESKSTESKSDVDRLVELLNLDFYHKSKFREYVILSIFDKFL